MSGKLKDQHSAQIELQICPAIYGTLASVLAYRVSGVELHMVVQALIHTKKSLCKLHLTGDSEDVLFQAGDFLLRVNYGP